MLLTEWNMEDALAVRYLEGYESGFESKLKKYFKDGDQEKFREIVCLAVARAGIKEGIALKWIHEVTGLDIETIRNLSMQSNA